MKHSLLYPEFTMKNKIHANHSVPIITLFSPNPEKTAHLISRGLDSKKKVSHLRTELKAELRKQIDIHQPKLLFISAEGLSGMKFGRKDLNAMKTYFKYEYGHQVQFQIIMILRNPVHWYPSIIQQQLKGIHTLESSKNIWQTKSKGYFKQAVKKFTDTFGYEQTTVLRFEDVIKYPNGMASGVLEASGLKKVKLTVKKSLKKKNASMSMEIATLLSGINESVPKIKGPSLNTERKGFKIQHMLGIPGVKFTIDPSLLRALLEQTKADMDWCFKTFGLKPYKSHNIPSKHSQNVWSIRTLFQILTRFLAFPPKIRTSIVQTLKHVSEDSLQHIYLSQRLKWKSVFAVIWFFEKVAPCTDLFLWYDSTLRKAYRNVVRT